MDEGAGEKYKLQTSYHGPEEHHGRTVAINHIPRLFHDLNTCQHASWSSSILFKAFTWQESGGNQSIIAQLCPICWLRALTHLSAAVIGVQAQDWAHPFTLCSLICSKNVVCQWSHSGFVPEGALRHAGGLTTGDKPRAIHGLFFWVCSLPADTHGWDIGRAFSVLSLLGPTVAAAQMSPGRADQLLNLYLGFFKLVIHSIAK